jgi:hypothetical protein
VNALPWLLAAALFATPGDDFTIRHGEIVARLRLEIPDEGAGASRARVRLYVEVTGPQALEVTGPRLEDALSAWRIRRLASSWRSEDGRAVIGLSLTLEQVKPGVVALPGVVLRAREGDNVPWQDFSWPDLLSETHDSMQIDVTPAPPASPWPARLGVAALAVAVPLALLFVVRAVVRHRRPRPVPAHVRALAAVKKVEQSPGEALARLDQIVREYLDERFGLSTRRQTGREMLDSCATVPEEARRAIAELSSKAELAKYAGVVPDEAQRRRALELARAAIGACAALPVGQAAEGKENGRTATAG